VKKGQGVEVKQNGLHIVLGNRSLLKVNHIDLTTEVDEYMKARERMGETALIVAHGIAMCDDAHGNCCSKKVCGVVTLSHAPRERAADAVQALRSSGVQRISLYSGDNHCTASSIAGKLGIKEVAGGLLPEDKANRIEAMMEQGHTVVMVGDGINDAPALATANLGIAMGVAGSDIAVQAADVAVLNDDIMSVPRVIHLGRKTLTVIKQNLSFAVLFNTVMIGLASQGVIGMVAAAAFHQGSSLLVLLNSMRLLRRRQFLP